MKKYLAVFIAVLGFTSLAAYAEGVLNKKCYRQCIKEINDKEKCTFICTE